MRPGTRVICMDAQFPPEILKRLQGVPKYGETYVIRDLVPDPKTGKVSGVTLVGLNNPNAWMPAKHGFVLTEYFFRINRFMVENEEDDHAWTNQEVDVRQLSPVIRN